MMKYGLKCAFIFCLGLNLVSSISKADEAKSEVGDNNIYVFATFGLASLDANISSSVNSGSLSVTSTLDDEGSSKTFGVGWQKSKNVSFEIYAGEADGFNATTTLTATNAVINGNTYNGTLSVNEEISGTLVGANAVFTNAKRFTSGSTLSFSGRVGLAQHNVKDNLSVSGAGTVNGVSYSAASPILTTIEEKGTSLTYGAGLNFAVSDDFEFSFGITHIPSLGGGDLVEADLTSYDIGFAVKF